MIFYATVLSAISLTIKLPVKDIPERWNEESGALLGQTPNTLSEGALQNPDWFTGRFGFIPTNTLSHIIAAQVHETLYDKIEDFPAQVKKGHLENAGQWVKEKHSSTRSQTRDIRNN